MQNKCNNCARHPSGDTGFVSLDGSWGSAGWSCGNCGCNNCGCDSCARCGWNRCGNGCGAVVTANARRNRGDKCDKCDECGERQNDGCDRESRNGCECEHRGRSRDCDCAEEACSGRSQYVECCDDNTSIRDRSDGCDKDCRQNRSASCGKRNSDAAHNQSRSDACGKCGKCGKDSCNGCGRKNKGVGMVWAVEQELDQVFESESALRSGTLFPELHKPMNGYCPGDCNCQTDEQAAAFAAWELRLYLNTHPNDKQALALFRKLCGETCDPNYATSFLKDADCACGWSWTDDPWPWECRPCGK